MSGASVERVLGLWSAELGGLKTRTRPLFAHPRMAASAAAFLDGLLGPERRETGWMRAEAAGDPGPWRQQAVLGRSHWEADVSCTRFPWTAICPTRNRHGEVQHGRKWPH